MFSNLSPIKLLAIGVLIVASLVVVYKFLPQNSKITQETSTPGTSKESPTPTSVVPPPTEEDVIRTFYNLINGQRSADAVGMMSEGMMGNESQKQAWGVQFNAFKSASVKSIAPSMKEEWMSNRHSYKVTLDVAMKPEAASAPIPNYGYENGENIRWVSIEKIGNLWKIAEIATGP